MTFTLRAFDLTTGDYLDDLPDQRQASLGFTYGSIDAAMTLDYPTNGHAASLLANDIEIRLLWDDVEVEDGAWISRGQTGDAVPQDEGGVVRLVCKHLTDVYRKVLLLPTVAKQTDLTFTGATPGGIIKSVLDLAAARGAFGATEFDYSTFDAATDSAGTPWPTTVSQKFPVGLSVRDVLNNLFTRGLLTPRMVGRSLRLYAGIDVGVHQDEIVLSGGHDLSETPYRRSTEERISHLLVQGDDGVWVMRSVGGPRREEGYLTQGGTSDTGTLSVIGDNMLAKMGNEREQRTVRTTRDYPVIPGVDYRCGDWLIMDTDVTEEQRVRQFTVELDDSPGHTTVIVLNDRILEANIARAIRQDAVTSGVAPGAVTQPTVSTVDQTTPDEPTGLGGTSDAYLDTLGNPRGQVSLSWLAPTTNTDGSVLTDLAGYQVLVRDDDPTATWRVLGEAYNIYFDVSDLPVGAWYRFAVRAFDSSNHVSALSAEFRIQTAADTSPPPVPSAPQVTAYLGQIVAVWDGKDEIGGTAWPPDFSRVEVHASIVDDFTPDATTYRASIRATQGGNAILTGYAYGTEVFVKLVAVDTSFNASAASAQGSATTSRVSGLDLESGAISYKTIGYKDEGNLVIDGSFERADTVPNAVAQSSTLDAAMTYVQDTTAGFHGTSSLKATAASATTINSYLNLTPPPNEPSSNDRAMAIPIREGDKFFVRYAYKAEAGTSGIWRVEVRWGAADGTVVDVTYMTLGLLNTTFTETSSGNFTAPTGTAFVTIRLYTEAGSAGTIWLDAVEVRKKIGTAIIEDAAITNAHIADLAVDDAKIANIDGGKINAQSITTTALALGSVGPRQSAFGIGGNLIPNPNWSDGTIRAQYPMTAPWEYNSSTSTWITGGTGVIMRSESCWANATRDIGPSIPVKPGERYWMHVQMKRYQTTVPASFNLHVVDETGANVAWDLRPATAPGTAPNLTWVTYEGTVTIPEGGEFVVPQMKWHGSGPDIVGWWAFADFELRPILSTAVTGGPGTEISPRGIRLYDDDGEQAVSMVTGEANFMTFRSNGVAVASISDDGKVSGSVLAGDEIYSGGRLLTDILDDLARGVVAQGYVANMNVSGITSNVGLYELSFTAYPDRYYDIHFGPFYVKSTVAGDLANVNIRATVDGTSPTTSNGSQYHSAIYEIASTSSPGFGVYNRVSGTFAVPAGGGTVRLLLCLSRYSGTGSLTASSAATYPLRYEVYDMGRDVPDTAVRNTGGGGTTTKKQYVKTYACTWSRRYGNAGSTTGEMYQGYYSGTWGTQRSAAGFSSWGTDLSGASVQKIELYVYANHWYYNSGGTLRIGVHQTGSTDPGSNPASLTTGGYIDSTNWPKPGGRWVVIPSGWYPNFANNTWKGFTFGWDLGSSTNRIYYGKFNGNGMSHEPQVRITYTK